LLGLFSMSKAAIIRQSLEKNMLVVRCRGHDGLVLTWRLGLLSWLVAGVGVVV
jgi:hypothetical protein